MLFQSHLGGQLGSEEVQTLAKFVKLPTPHPPFRHPLPLGEGDYQKRNTLPSPPFAERGERLISVHQAG
ncbi:MAG: hypothetical protein DMG06_08745 [Acidobacteria bacterium]|nr:MAG: hypothetical protein DMG06_08745 [Acidobacteriota bacterium]